MAKTAQKKTATKKATPIAIRATVGKKTVATKKATSVSNMWVLNKAIFAEFPTAVLTIRKDGELFMKLHLETKANGKTWMKNDIQASRRKVTKKTVKETAAEAAEIHTITEAEAEAAAEAI